MPLLDEETPIRSIRFDDKFNFNDLIVIETPEETDLIT